jgi:hypothetical protein
MNRERAYTAAVKKQPEMDCGKSVLEEIRDLIKTGWSTERFEYERHAKERHDPAFMRHARRINILGAVRLFVVEEIFLCSNQEQKSIYHSFGSEGAVSDYDITITGQTAPLVMQRMIREFFRIYNWSFAHSFDTNIYVLGYYDLRGLKPRDELLAIEGDLAVLTARTQKDITTSMTWACAKLRFLTSRVQLPESLEKAANTNLGYRATYFLQFLTTALAQTTSLSSAHTRLMRYCLKRYTP